MKRFLASLLLMVCIMPFALRADEVEGPKSRFFYDFNDTSLEGWNPIDVDNDGFGWLIHSDGYIYSESSEQLKPNNVFATRSKYAIYSTSKISFDARPLDTLKTVEKYGIGIAYSLDGVSFLTLQDETALATPTEWNKIEISLEYLAGKEVYLGILHYTMDDQGTILVDNIKLTDGLLTPVENVVAAESENNVNLSWDWNDEDSNEPVGYNVYREKTNANGTSVMIANNITEKTYQDTEWNSQEWGIYRWGVAALYEQSTRGTKETLLEEGFETTEYPNLPEGWSAFSAPASAGISGKWQVTEAIDMIINPIAGEKLVFSYGGYAYADFYLVTPAIDLTRAIAPEFSFSYASPGKLGGNGDPLYVKCSETADGPWTELWTETSNSEWKNTTIDLSAYSGKTIYIAFVHQDLKDGNYGVGIDNVSVEAQLSETALPVASRIAWSNVIEKDMNTTVNFTVATDDNASTEGAEIILKNINETQYQYTVSANATGSAQFTEVRRGDYEYSVNLSGYYTYIGKIAVYEESSIGCILEKKPELIDGLYVSPTAWAMWDYANENAAFDIYLDGEIVEENFSGKYYQFDVESLEEGQEYTTTILPKDQYVMFEYTWKYAACNDFANAVNFKIKKEETNAVLTWDMPIYEEPLAPAFDFSTNFDNGTLEGWATIDADGDARNWQNTSEFANQGFGIDSSFCAASISFDNEIGAINPDNFLVTGRKYSIIAGSKLTFSVASQSKDNPEHYGVAISTKSNTKANDFMVIFEETMPDEENSESPFGQWYEKTVDLSEYAGQDIYIAFRHYNSANKFWIKLDNVSLTSGKTRGDREEGEWLYYDNGVFESASGSFDATTMQPTQINWAIMFPAELIEDYAKRPITKVALYDYSAHRGAFSIHQGGDTAPGTMVHVQSYETTGKKAYVEIELDTPVTISGNENIWIQFSNEYGSGDYVAAYSADMGDPNSRWRSDDGSMWYDNNWYGEGWYGTWMIRAFVGEKDESIIEDPEITTVETLGTIIYRNGELITPEPIKENTYTDAFSADEESVEYTIRVVYGGIKDQTYYAMSCPLTKTFVTKEPLICVRPQNLYGETTLKEDGTFGATLIWPYVKEWLYYDNGTPEKTFGGNNNQVYWGIMFPAKDLAKYAGTNLTKVALYNKNAGDATLTISYGGDFAPGTPVHTQDFTFLGEFEEGIFEVKLTTPVPISGEENIWVTIYQNGTQFPAVATKGTGDPNGRWISFDGVSWSDLLALNPDYNNTWFLRAYVSTEATRDNGEFDHYNIYRSTSNSNYELIDSTKTNTYFDEVAKGTYYYQVTSVYKRGEETCESDPASAYNELGKDYVVVEVTKIDENGVKGMMVYPNPAKDNLNITAENMRRITISNVLGQIVYDRETNSDNEIINMSQYEAGIYMVRIATENGIAVKRISVAK